jgi:hypothetical protein
MKLDDLDHKLQELNGAAERISANLVELEIDSSRQLLEASTLEGESAARWSAASVVLDELWRRQGLLEGLVKQGDKLRRSRRADQLRSLLEGPSIELASSDVPLAERELLGSPQVTDRCSPDELLDSMSVAFDQVKTVISRVGEAWDTSIPRLDAARRLLQETKRLADDLGESPSTEVDSAAQTLHALSASITTDPLSVKAKDVDRLIEALEAIRNDLAGCAALKRGLDARLLEARELLERLRAAVREGRAAHEEALIKIAVPAVPGPMEPPNNLELGLTEIAELAHRGAWRRAQRALEEWTAHTTELLDDARRTLDASRAPIEARNQFRALLEAYQVKAKRLGRLEDPRLADIFGRAQEELYTAPTDLALAAQLVRSYQQALSGSRATPEAMT